LRPSHHLVAYPSQFESSLSSSVLRSDNAQQSRRQMVAVEAQRSRRFLECVDLLRAQHLKDDNRVIVWVPLPTARLCILHGPRDCNIFTPLGAVTTSDHSLEVFLLDSQEYSFELFVCDYPVHNRRFMPLCTLVHGGTSSSDDTDSSDYTTSIGSGGAMRLYNFALGLLYCRRRGFSAGAGRRCSEHLLTTASKNARCCSKRAEPTISGVLRSAPQRQVA
jgi:hypothetical protein